MMFMRLIVRPIMCIFLCLVRSVSDEYRRCFWSGEAVSVTTSPER